MITSTHNPKLQLARALLARAKDRREEGAFVAEGVRLVEEALQAGWPFRYVLFNRELSERGMELIAKLQAARVPCEEVRPEILNSISETQHSQGVLAALDFFSLPVPNNLTFALILDSIRDPGNLGTLLRTAAAAGVECVFLPPETADAFSPKVVRAGMGAHFHVPIRAESWQEIGKQVERLNIYVAGMEGSLSCWQADFKARTALIIGGEADGASEAARGLGGSEVAIPMPGQAESLNAAVAGGILMFEVVRQRSADDRL
jgi:TrmH family RNA methyltransferase